MSAIPESVKDKALLLLIAGCEAKEVAAQCGISVRSVATIKGENADLFAFLMQERKSNVIRTFDELLTATLKTKTEATNLVTKLWIESVRKSGKPQDYAVLYNTLNRDTILLFEKVSFGKPEEPSDELPEAE